MKPSWMQHERYVLQLKSVWVWSCLSDFNLVTLLHSFCFFRETIVIIVVLNGFAMGMITSLHEQQMSGRCRKLDRLAIPGVALVAVGSLYQVLVSCAFCLIMSGILSMHCMVLSRLACDKLFPQRTTGSDYSMDDLIWRSCAAFKVWQSVKKEFLTGAATCGKGMSASPPTAGTGCKTCELQRTLILPRVKPHVPCFHACGMHPDMLLFVVGHKFMLTARISIARHHT